LSTLVFSHANGYPAGTYRVLFEAWRAAGMKVIAPEKFGHDPAFPVSSNWPRLRDQLIAFIDQQAPGEKVHLVGHSLGGYLSLLAACRRPDLARSVVLIDSPIVAGWRAHSVQVMKMSRLMQRAGPGRVSVRRRWQWPSAEAAYQHFAVKHAFARWPPEVLRDYIAAGTEPDPAVPGGVRLAFRREVETHIYNTLPHDLQRLLRRHPPRCPVAYLAGTRSAEGRQAGLAATRALVHERLAWIEGTHLFPMERPAETAAAVLALLARV
jgi:pimeloyl-ACP methyl ester carboxylesterase